MTTIGQQLNKFSLTPYLIGGLLLVLSGAFFCIRLSTEIVELRYSVTQEQEILTRLEVENVELSDEVYALTSPEALQKTAAELGFVREAHPTYLDLGAELLAEQL